MAGIFPALHPEQIQNPGERAAIRGVTGSRKTMLALAKAQREARAGCRTLLLCCNQQLQDWLKAAVPEWFARDLAHLHARSLGLA